MTDLRARLASGEVVVADGAIGSLLFEHGLEPGACPEALNLSRPELLERIAGLYLDAGAEIVQTNTFGGSALKLAVYDLDDRTEEINRAAVDAVRRAVGDRAWVSGSCGPCGRMIRPLGDVEPGEVRESFLRQTRALVAGGVDMLCIETMTDLTEASLAIEAARQASGSAARDPVVVATMTFDRTPRGYFTIMGVDLAAAVAGLEDAGAEVIGSNCGNGSENMVEIARELRTHTSLPLIIQPNAGLPEIVDGKTVYPESPAYFAEKCKELATIGVSIVGGCCGTTAAHVRALRKVVR